MSETGPCRICGKSTDSLAAGLCPVCLLRTAIESGASRALAPFLPDLRYFGDYELLEEIARGGMGVVYRARQVSLDRTVAVKMMRPGLLATESEIQRFRTEAKTAARLQHPHIVAIHEVGEFDGLHYFSMDFVEGPSLAELVRERPLSSAQAAGYVKILAETVQYAHSRGILHRDLKPSNVLVDSEGRPRITDFGLARPLEPDSSSTAGSVAGTPSYMSPEQAAGERQPLGPATDVYSLGAILYELLTGRPPFQGPTHAEIIRRVIGEEPVPPRALNPSVTRDLEAVCLKCLRKDPQQRYPSGAELARDLAHAQPGDRRTVPVWKWAAAAVAALGLAIAAWSILQNSAPRRETAKATPPPLAMPAAPVTVVAKPQVKPVATSHKQPREAWNAAATSAVVTHSTGNHGSFTFQYTAAPADAIGVAQIDFHRDAGDCMLWVEPAGHVGLQVYADRGPFLQVTGMAGTLATLESTACSVDLSAVSSTVKGDVLTVEVSVTFKPAFAGPLEIRSWPWNNARKVRGESRIKTRWAPDPRSM